MARNGYSPVGNWRRLSYQPFYCRIPPGSEVYIEVCDLRSDKHDRPGTIWTDGCHRVTVKSDLPGKPRSKTFYGEVAWCSAERYADDCGRQLERAFDKAERDRYRREYA